MVKNIWLCVVLLACFIGVTPSQAGFQPEPYKRYFQLDREGCVLIMGEPVFGATVDNTMRRIYWSKDCHEFHPFELGANGGGHTSYCTEIQCSGVISLQDSDHPGSEVKLAHDILQGEDDAGNLTPTSKPYSSTGNTEGG